MANNNNQVLGQNLNNKSTVNAKTLMQDDGVDWPEDFVFGAQDAEPENIPVPVEEPIAPVQQGDGEGIGLGDLARATGAGALDFVAGVGQLAENVTGYGEGLRDLASDGADSLSDGMSPDAKVAIERKLFDEDADGDLIAGDGLGEIDTWALKMAQGIGSMLPMMATGGVVGLGTKALIKSTVTKSMIKRGASAKAAERIAEKTATNLSANLGTTAAVGVGGAGSLGSAANEARENVLGMDHEFLAKNSEFYKKTVSKLVDSPSLGLNADQILDRAREETANYASVELSKDPRAIAGTAVAMVGDKLLFGALKGQANFLTHNNSITGSALASGIGEFSTELVEGGLQKYANNTVSNDVAGTDIDPWENVKSEGLEGGAIGFATGGTTGAVGAGIDKFKNGPVSNRNDNNTIDELNNAPVTDPGGNFEEQSVPGDVPVTDPVGNFEGQNVPGDAQITAPGGNFEEQNGQNVPGTEPNGPAFLPEEQTPQPPLPQEQAGLSNPTVQATPTEEPTNDTQYQNEAAEVPQEIQEAFANFDYLLDNHPDISQQFESAYEVAESEDAANKILDQMASVVSNLKNKAEKAAEPVAQSATPKPQTPQTPIVHNRIDGEKSSHNWTVDRVSDHLFKLDTPETDSIRDRLLSGELTRNTAVDALNDLNKKPNESSESIEQDNSIAAPIKDDTRGKGQQYHGTSEAITSLREDAYATKNIYGQGLYTTDATDIAEGYSKKGKGKNPAIHSVHKNKDLKLFDLEKPLKELTEVERSAISNASEELDHLLNSGEFNSAREIYDEFRDSSESQLLSADEVQDVFSSIQSNLESAGYDGMRHVGGIKTKKKPHNVEIIFNPKNTVSIDKEPSSNDQANTETAPKNDIINKAEQVIQKLFNEKGKLAGIRTVYRDNGFTADQLEAELVKAGHEVKKVADFERYVKAKIKSQPAPVKDPNPTNSEDVLNQKLKDKGIEPKDSWQGDLMKQREIIKQIASNGVDIPSGITKAAQVDQAEQFINDYSNSVTPSINDSANTENVETKQDKSRSTLLGEENRIREKNQKNSKADISGEQSIVDMLKGNAQSFDGRYGEVDLKDVAAAYVDEVIRTRKRISNADLEALADKHSVPFDVVKTFETNNGFSYDSILEHSKNGDPAAKEFLSKKLDISDTTTETENPKSRKSVLDKLDDSISKAEDDSWNDLYAFMDEQKGTLNSGINPVLVAMFAKASAFTLMKGSVKFAKWVRDALDAAKAKGFEEEKLKELHGYLKETYASIAANPEKYNVSDDIADQMTSNKELRAIKDIDAFVKSQTKVSKLKATSKKSVVKNSTVEGISPEAIMLARELMAGKNDLMASKVRDIIGKIYARQVAIGIGSNKDTFESIVSEELNAINSDLVKSAFTKAMNQVINQVEKKESSKNGEPTPSESKVNIAIETNAFDFSRKAMAGEKFKDSDGKTLWIEEANPGWVVKEEDDRGTFSHGGNLLQGGWSKHLALDKLESKLENDLKQSEGNDNDNGITTGTNGKQSPRGEREASTNESQGNNDSNQAPGRSSSEESGAVSENGGELQDSRVGRSKGTTTDPFNLNSVGDTSKQTPAVRVASNIEAIKTLRLVQDENRPATDQEKATLAKYTGWGALGNVFAESPKQKYLADAQAELKTLLTPEEEAGIRSSLATAFYTSKEVVDAMWKGIEAFNLGNGSKINVLEPTVGSGNFIGYQPSSLRERSNWSASEIDPLTGNIARLIYSDANVLVKGFEKAAFKDNSFSLAIGNPPFGSFTVSDKTRPHLSGQRIHNYILGKSADLLHDNGLVAMVISNGFMDTNHGHQAELNKKMEFVGAVRLPNNAFKNAGTEVVTDIVILRKRPAGEAPTDSAWTNTKGKVNGVEVNKYFEENPQNILGNTTLGGTMYRGDAMTVEPTAEHSDLGKSISDRITAMAKGVDVSLNEQAQDAINSDVNLVESELALNGMMLDSNGVIRKRVGNDENGAVVVDVDSNTVWDKRGTHAQAIAAAIRSNNVDKITTEMSQILSTKSNRPASAFSIKAFQVAADYFYSRIATDQRNLAKSRPTKADTLSTLDSFTEKSKLGDNFKTVKSMLGLRNKVLSLLQAERTDANNIEQLRKELNNQYDELVKGQKKTKRFTPSVDHSISLMNGDLGIESGLDYVDNKGAVKKADIFNSRQVYPTKIADTADTLEDAVVFAIQQTGGLNIPKVAELLGIEKSEAIEQLTAGERPYIMRNHVTNENEFIDDYLSGNVKAKYEAAKLHNDDKGMKLLKESFPKDVSAKQIQPTIRGVWISPDAFNSFARALGVDGAKTNINKTLGQITLSGAVISSPTEIGAKFVNKHVSIVQLFNLAANGKTKTITYDVAGKRVKDEKATKQVNALINSMISTFEVWSKAADGVLDSMAKDYNEKVNVWAERKYNGSLYLKPQGQRFIEGFDLRPTQLNGALRMVTQNAVLLDHTVGAGKTFTAITGMMERKRLGLSKKPLLAVPNHIIGDFRKDFSELYPGANVLYPGKKSMSASERKQFLSRIATGSYDAIILGHSHLSLIPNDAESEKSVINEQLTALRSAKEEANQNKKDNGGRATSVAQIEKSIAALEAKLKDREEKIKENKDDIGYTFKDLGIDYLTIDEAHEFKNLLYSTSNDRVVGMNDPAGSNKSLDLLTKLRHIQNKDQVTNGGVTFMTGTPVSNSLVELYTLANYLARPSLDELNIGQYDAFAATFLQTQTAMEYTPQGTIKERTVLKGIANGKGLSDLYRQFADVVSLQTLQDIHQETKGTRFPVPLIKTGKRQINSAPITPLAKEYNDYLIARSEAIDTASDKKEYAKIDNPLWVMSDARKAGLDIRLVDPLSQREEDGKINRSSTEIMRIYNDWNHVKGAQVVFSDMGAPAKGAAGRAKKSLEGALAASFGETKAKTLLTKHINEAIESGDPLPLSKALKTILEYINSEYEAGNVDEDALEVSTEIAKEAQSEAITADTGFSVYDDLRQSLVEKGIPENEIAFIHEYDGSPDKKAELFAMVNSGEIRVLIGSTPKMGAGTNMQERLVALHHLDSPWRPSDMEQREGRIIRQKNSLYAADPEGFEIEIIAYTTDGSSDVVMWQILERKSAAINGFRLGHISNDLDSSSEDTDSYSALKAQASGSEVYKDKLKAEKALIEADNDLIGVGAALGSAKVTIETHKERTVNNNNKLTAYEATAKLEDAPWYSDYVAEIEREQDAFDKAEAKYAIDQKAFKALSADERKAKKVTKPKKPVLKSSLDYDNPHAKAVKATVIDAQAALDEAVLFPIDKQSKDPMKIELERDGETKLSNGLVLYWTVTKRAGFSVSTEFSLVGQDRSQTFDLVDFKSVSTDLLTSQLMPNLAAENIVKEIKKSIKIVQKRLDSLVDKYEKAKAITDKSDIKPVKQKADKARAIDSWLQTEIEFTDYSDSFRRANSPNKFIAADGDRNVKQSSSPTISELEGKFAGKTYNLFYKNTNGIQSTSAIGTDANGNYVQAKLIKEEAAGIEPEESEFFIQSITTNDNELSQSDLSVFEEMAVATPAEQDALDIPSFRVGNPQDLTTGSLSKTTVESIAAGIRSTENLDRVAVGFKVVQKESDLPKAIQDTAEQDDATGQVKGVLHDDVVYLVADNHKTAAEVEETIFHEIVGHFGLRNLMGKSISSDLQMLVLGLGGVPGVRKLAKEFNINLRDYEISENKRVVEGELTKEQASARLLDELIAHVAQSPKKNIQGIFARLFAKVRHYLRLAGYKRVAKYKKGDLIELIARARRNINTPPKNPDPTPEANKPGKKRPSQTRPLTAKERADKNAMDRPAFSRSSTNEQVDQEQELQDDLDKALSQPNLPNKAKGVLDLVGRGMKRIAQKDGTLALLTLRQLGDVASKKLPQVQSYYEVVEKMLKKRNILADKAGKLAHDMSQWANKNQEEAKHLFDLMHRATIAGVDPDDSYMSMQIAVQNRMDFLTNDYYRNNPNTLSGLSDAEMDKESSQYKEMQALEKQLAEEAARNDEWSKLHSEYAELSDEAKKQYRAMRDEYSERQNTMEKLLIEQIAQSELDSNTQKRRRLDIKTQFELQRVQAPYFPLARFGDYWIKVKDKSGEMRFYMHETQGKQQSDVRKMQQAGFKPEFGYKIDNSFQLDGASSTFITNLLGGIDQQDISDGQKNAVKDMAYQMYLQSLPSRSIRKTSMHRKGTKGYSQDALRAMASNLSRSSNQLSRMEYADELQALVNEAVKKGSKGTDNQVGRYANELVKRHQWVLNPTHSTFAQKTASVGFVYMLGFSSSAAIINASQNFVIGLPVIGSHFGMTATANEMTKVMAKVSRYGVIGKFENALSGDELKAYKEWHDLGTLQDTQVYSLAGLAENESLNYSPKYERAMQATAYLFQKAEIFNREVATLTTYRLARRDGMDHKAAVKIASDLTKDIHFEYTNANRARIMQSPSMKVITQFKQYSQQASYYLLRNAYQSFKGETPAVKKMARQQLLGSLAVTAVIGGASALPLSTLYIAANLLHAALGDDDEPFDAETETLEYLSSLFGGNSTLVNGVFGAGVSSRVSLNDLWVRSSHKDMNADEAWTFYAKQVAGPVYGGIGVNMFKGVQDLSEGNIMRGVERILPKALRDPLKAYRYQDEGALSYSGAAYKTKEDFTIPELIIQAFGFADNDLSEVYEKNSRIKQYAEFVTNRRKTLLASLYVAYNQKDDKAKTKLFIKIKKFNKKYPEIAVSNDSIRRSFKMKDRNITSSQNGLKLSDKVRRTLAN